MAEPTSGAKSLKEQFWDPVAGFGVTFRTMFKKVVTEQYPFEKMPTAPRFHGRHQLNRWPDGLEKCIGCELCAWACPADAIYVEGASNTDDERFSPGERYGRVYQINYLRCILCGLCIEACPTRALTMTNEYELADNNRADLIYEKSDLLAPLLPGMEQPPHPMRLGDDEGAYYRGEFAASRAEGGDPVIFWILAPIMVIAALGILFVRKAVHAALLLAVVMISLAFLYASLDAPFLFAVQIIVYTGAILMLFLFVVMLVGVDASDSVVETIRGQRVLAIIGGLLLGLVLVIGLSQMALGTVVGLDEANAGGNVEALADILFSRYVFAFETTSALLITAAVGAMVLAHRERLVPKSSQADLANQRVRDYGEHGLHLGPMPAPGVYARHNAVDTPALLPDGTAAESSVSRVLIARGTVRSAPAMADDVPAVERQLSGDRDQQCPPVRLLARRGGDVMTQYVILSAILFTIGSVGVLTRRNALVVFMCVELMLNGSNLALVAFAKQHGNLDGQVAAFFVMVVAAAEVVVGLAIIMTIFRTRRSASVDDASLLKF